LGRPGVLGGDSFLLVFGEVEARVFSDYKGMFDDGFVNVKGRKSCLPVGLVV
jgi:hypothetical protein